MSGLFSALSQFVLLGEGGWQAWIDELLAHHESGSFELSARFVFVVGCLSGAAALWHFLPLSIQEKKGAVAAGLVHFMLASMLEWFILRQGVYSYIINKQMLWGVPFDVHFGWAALWGAGLCMAWRSVKGSAKWLLVAGAIGATLAMDFAALATGRIFTPLTPWWWMWDLGALIILSLSTIGFYRLIIEHRALVFRATVYAAIYAFMFFVLIPAMILELSHSKAKLSDLLNPWSVAALAVVSLPGLVATFQFVFSGDGSPLPLDPTRKLVTNGIYAYVRNPMQIAGFASAVVWACTVPSVYLWIYVVDLAVLLQLTKYYEDRELTERFGAEFERYRSQVRAWIPRLTPNKG